MLRLCLGLTTVCNRLNSTEFSSPHRMGLYSLPGADITAHGTIHSLFHLVYFCGTTQPRWFPVAAVTNGGIFNGSKQQECVLSSSGAQSSEMKVWTGLHAPGDSQESLAYATAGSQWWLAVPIS